MGCGSSTATPLAGTSQPARKPPRDVPDYQKGAELIKSILNDDPLYATLFLRLVWADAVTFDKDANTGGINGSVRFEEHLCKPIHTGLVRGLDVLYHKVKKDPDVTRISYADLWTLASVVALEKLTGHTLDFKPGKVDAVDDDGEDEKYDDPQDAEQLKTNWKKMGLSNEEGVTMLWIHFAHKREEPGPFSSAFLQDLEKASEGLEASIVSDQDLKAVVDNLLQDGDLFTKTFVAAFAKVITMTPTSK